MSQTMPVPLVAPPPLKKPAPAAPVVKPSKPSAWIWIPYIWLFIISTRSLDIWLRGLSNDTSSIDPDLNGAPLDRAVMALLILLSLFVLFKRAKRTKEILRQNKWLLVLFLYMTLSVIWSNFPGITFRRTLRSMGTTAVVLVLLTEADRLGAIRALLRRLYLVIIPVSIITIRYFRNIGVTYNWSGDQEEWLGLATDKNSLGQVAMCSGLVSTWQILQNWSKKKLTLDLLLLVLTLWVLRGSKTCHSSTAIIGFLTGAAVLFGLQYIKKKKKTAHAKRIVLTATLGLIVLTPIAYLVFEAFDTTPVNLVLEATGRDLTFTDRTLLWTDVLHNAEKSPIVGVGFGAFWVGHIGYDMYPLENWSRKTPGWRPGQGHDGYIDVYVDLGVIGLALMLIVIGVGFSGALDDLQHDFELGSLRLVFLLSIVMNNITETSFLKGTYSLWFLFLLFAINVPRPRFRKEQRSSEAF